MKARLVFVAGPAAATGSGAYGGGVGGYTRNLSAYLSSLTVPGVQFAPFFCTVRGASKTFLREALIVRLLLDIWNFSKAVLTRRPWAVHVLAQYRGALSREVLICLICRLCGIHHVYDVKAGLFAHSFETGSWLYRAGARFIIKNSQLILAEGQSTKRFIEGTFSVPAIYFPNFVPAEEIPTRTAAILQTEVLRVLFVGFCYPAKGVVDLIRGCNLAAQRGIKINLTLVGAEHPDFTEWADAYGTDNHLALARLGRLPHDKVLLAMSDADIYGYPTSHAGEGHNNSINEAMMHGLAIVTTAHGFLPEVLTQDCAFFLQEVQPEYIAQMIELIASDKAAASQRGACARNRMLSEFTSTRASARLTDAYAALSRSDHGPRPENDASI